MPFVGSHDTEIYYEFQGEVPAILFAHGGGGNAASWLAQAAHFRASHRCIAFDHRGFGCSRWHAERFEEPETFNAAPERFFQTRS